MSVFWWRIPLTCVKHQPCVILKWHCKLCRSPLLYSSISPFPSVMMGYSEIVWHGLMLYFVLEEKFAQAVCFLLVDLYLLTFQPEKALHLLAVLEKLTVQGNNKNGKGEVGPVCCQLLLFIF